MNMRFAPGVDQYQSFTQEQMILSLNMKLSPCVYPFINIHTRADDSITEHEIVTRCTSISIIHTGADDSINEYEIITVCISLSIIHT